MEKNKEDCKKDEAYVSMSALDMAVPIGLGIGAFAVFYTSFRYRKGGILGMFEFLYALGNLLVLALLYTILLSLQASNDGFWNVVYPLFQAMMWIYLLIFFVLMFRLLRNILDAIGKKKTKEYLGW